jgi:hypothetical protein
MADVLEASTNVALENPLRGIRMGQHDETLSDGIRRGALRPEPIRVRVARRFRDGSESEQVQCLHRSVTHRGDVQGALSRAVRFVDVDAPQREGFVAPLLQRFDGPRFLLRCIPDDAVHSWGLLAFVFRHSTNGEYLAAV